MIIGLIKPVSSISLESPVHLIPINTSPTFWPGSRKQGYGQQIDLKFGTNNGTDDTSKHAKF